MEDTTVNVGGMGKVERAEIEATRGILRDENGVIIRTREWREERAKLLEQKLVDIAQCIDNVNKEIGENAEALASME